MNIPPVKSSKVRVPNFTSSEKHHLLRIIVNKYSSIIEDKKTDRVSTEKKEKAWQQITKDFNASSSTGILRSLVSLKKFYENRKKQLRKTLAEEKREVTLTGGGPPPKIKKDDTDELLMSIINKKTLVGFNNKFDDDGDDSCIVPADPDKSTELELTIVDQLDDGSAENVTDTHSYPGRETFLQIEETQTSQSAAKNDSWRKYTPTNLQEPISAALGKTSTSGEQKKPIENMPEPDHAKITPSSRRRPTTVVKSLTSSEIAKKYDLLLDKRLLLVEGQLKHMEEENALIIRKRKIEVELLEAELLLKKKQLE